MSTTLEPGNTRLSLPEGIQNDIDSVNASLEAEEVTTAEQTRTNVGLSTNNDKTLNKANYNPKTVSILQNTYYFSGEEARQISAFAKAVEEKAPKFSVNVEPGFLTKIKSLCAKILTFFGNKNGEVKLQKEGIAVFKELKGTLLDPQNKDFTLNFLKQNEGNQEVLKGFARVLGIQTPENINSATDLYYCLIDPQLLKTSPDIKTFLEQVVLPISKEEVLAELEKNLGKASKSMTTDFSLQNQIFKDLERNFTLTLHVDGKVLNIEVPKVREEGTLDGEIAFKALKTSIASLSGEQQKEVKEFCKNFPTQGVVRVDNQLLGGFPARINGHEVHLDVHVSERTPHVVVTTGGKEAIEVAYPGGIVTDTVTPVCKFEFDYNPENGSSSNVKLMEYSGQTISITRGSTAEGWITF